MKANYKCEHCGKESETVLRMKHGKIAWFIIPLSILPGLFFFSTFYFKPDLHSSLSIKNVSKKTKNDSSRYLEVKGKIKNTSNSTWDGVQVEAEFFDKNGEFIDEATEYISSQIAPQGSENFLLKIRSSDNLTYDPETRMVLKISDGRVSIF